MRRPQRLGSVAVPAFKPAYLIHGDDHGRIAERRARLRALAEELAGA
jgi:DNA polymerase-3 subunit delta